MYIWIPRLFYVYVSRIPRALIICRNLFLPIQILNHTRKKLKIRSATISPRDIARFLLEIESVDRERIVFADLTNSDSPDTNRLYGWSKRGTPAIRTGPVNRGSTKLHAFAFFTHDFYFEPIIFSDSWTHSRCALKFYPLWYVPHHYWKCPRNFDSGLFI